jgi:hypothetical protein
MFTNNYVIKAPAKTTLTQLNFAFNSKQDYDDNIYRLLVALPPGTCLEVSELTRDPEHFVKAVIYNCELMELRNIEFSNNPLCLCKKNAAK